MTLPSDERPITIGTTTISDFHIDRTRG